MFDSSVVAEAIDLGFESQPMPDGIGILNGRYLVGSNESELIWMATPCEYLLINLMEMDRICRVRAMSSRARTAELIAASRPYVA